MAISGTNVSNFESIDVDLKFAPEEVDLGLFPDATGAEVHRGFQAAFKRIIGAVQAAVEANMQGKNVFVTGHSLGQIVAL